MLSPIALTSREIAITRPPFHHFFGYYDKCPWDKSGRFLLGMEADFKDRAPTENDVARLGLIDSSNGFSWTPLAETRAWNWQQGCMLQWVGDGGSNRIIFNDRRENRFVARILDIATGHERVLDWPIASLNPAGDAAVSLNFSRLHHQRFGYGYAGVDDPWYDVAEPVDDGLYRMDLATGSSTLIASIARIASFKRTADFDGKIHRFNHAQFSPGGNRFAFLHRYKVRCPKVGETRLLTMNLDGTELCHLAGPGLVSHYDWLDSKKLLAWADRPNARAHYFLFHDRDSKTEIVGEDSLACDGHCSFSPNDEWLLTDTYPDGDNFRTLILYHLSTGERIDIARFYSPPVKDWAIRCDLHPRWNRDGTQICFDSVHEGSRQIYILDIGRVTGGA